MLQPKRRVVCLGLLTAATAAQDPVPAVSQPPQGPASQPTAQAPKQLSGKGLTLKFDETTLKLGGYIKVDLIHDFDEIGSTDSFDPRTIPTDDESRPGTNTRMHARQTRFNLDLRTPTDVGPMKLFFEGDFFGDGNTFRIRHAYGEVDERFLAGQTWTTFMDEDAMPETLDFESPIAFPQIRQAMVRYTHKLEGGSHVAVALEDPASKIIAPATPGQSEEPTPDLTGRVRWKNGLGHVQLSGFAGTARYRPDSGGTDTVFLWGTNLSAKLNVVKEDNAFVQVTYGPGVGRYRGGTTAAPDANGHLDAVEVFGAMAGYEHHWSDQFRSTASYSWGKGNLPAGAPATTAEELEYLAANLIWQYCDRSWCGFEYLYGSREDMDGSRGEAHRIQFSVRFNF